MLQTMSVIEGKEINIDDYVSDFIRKAYYRPHILIAAESGVGKSTLLTRLSTKKLRKVLKYEIGKIRSTACMAKHYFDSELSDTQIAVMASKKSFGKIVDDFTVIMISESADKLVKCDQLKKLHSDEKIINELYESVFVQNSSLFNLSELCEQINRNDVSERIKKELSIILDLMLSQGYVELARKKKELNDGKPKGFTLKQHVEMVVTDKLIEIKDGLSIQDHLDKIFGLVKEVSELKINQVFSHSTELYLYSEFDVLINENDAINFMQGLFGATHDHVNFKNKGIQYFLDEVWIRIPTEAKYYSGSSFVIVDTEGLTHRSDNDDDVKSSFLKLINYNRVNHMIFMTPFATDSKVLNVVKNSLVGFKKRWKSTVFLARVDEYVSGEIVASGEEFDDDEERNDFLSQHIQPKIEDIVSNLSLNLKTFNDESAKVKFEEKIELVSFGDSRHWNSTTSKELYSIINRILKDVNEQFPTIPIRVKSSDKNAISYKIKEDELIKQINLVINSNELLPSLPNWRKLHPHWSSVYALKDKISYGSGHRTYAIDFDNFSIFPASKVEQSLRKLDISSLVEWDFENIVEIPEDVKDSIISEVRKDFENSTLRKIAIDLTYRNLRNSYYTQKHYLDWYRELLSTYMKLISDSSHWKTLLIREISELIDTKVEFMVDPMLSE